MGVAAGKERASGEERVLLLDRPSTEPLGLDEKTRDVLRAAP